MFRSFCSLSRWLAVFVNVCYAPMAPCLFQEANQSEMLICFHSFQAPDTITSSKNISNSFKTFIHCRQVLFQFGGTFHVNGVKRGGRGRGRRTTRQMHSLAAGLALNAVQRSGPTLAGCSAIRRGVDRIILIIQIILVIILLAFQAYLSLTVPRGTFNKSFGVMIYAQGG